MEISAKKTKLMSNSDIQRKIKVKRRELGTLNFKYFGAVVSCDG